jgi:hypothetical protein
MSPSLEDNLQDNRFIGKPKFNINCLIRMGYKGGKTGALGAGSAADDR